ncbi:MAG: cysteine desulfurase NifS [Clostridiales bacterium]|nr:cysteine desulfurase NifS [Clostridiales bacterium]
MFVYVDNAATTQVDPDVAEKVIPCFTSVFGNASSIHTAGRKAKELLDTAREQVANALGAEPGEIYFTAGGSESDNWAIKGVAHKFAKKGKHLITTAIEHHAVLHSMKSLEKEGFEVTYLPVDSEGFVTAEQVEKAIRPDTILVSVMFANNEIGSVEPIAEIGEVCKKHGVLFHTDAVQAVAHIKIDVKAMNIDMLSLSGHKFNAPKGVGALYIRKGITIPNLIDGGQQERGKRAGTENIPAIVGMGYAIEVATRELDERMSRVRKMRDRLRDELMRRIPYAKLNTPENSLPGTLNISFQYIEGESILLMLDMNGICASSGSACTSGSLDPSHVLLAIGLPHEIAHGSVRMSIDHNNTEEEIDHIIDTLPKIIQRLRDMSPLWERVADKKQCITD